ncbi:MAG: MmgE/PrpD family protein, partial [Chloroflexi bacterium]|nr:MmgE/PrpD family protein [Chloroflexota bacterium]
PMARAMDLGDCHEEAGHSAEYTLPALLAATGLKKQVTGKELITAFVVGQEVLIRIGIAFKRIRGITSGRGRGHYIFGPVAAVGKLLGMGQEDLENAEGIAREKTQPHDLVMYKPATLMVRVHHGFVCQDAITACLLARRGITGPRHEVLVGPGGYLEFAKWETEPAALTRDLGETWEMAGTMMKPFCSCKCTHTSVGGILEQEAERGFGAGDIASIHVDASTHIWNTVCIPREVRWDPRTVPECQFSLPYAVAAAAFDGSLFLDSYTPESMARPELRALISRTTVREDRDLAPFAARVTTALKDGRRYSGQYEYVKGHPRNPFTEADLADKFRRCAAYSAYRLGDAVVDSLIKILLHLENVDDVEKALLVPLTPG